MGAPKRGGQWLGRTGGCTAGRGVTNIRPKVAAPQRGHVKWSRAPHRGDERWDGGRVRGAAGAGAWRAGASAGRVGGCWGGV